MKCVLSLGLGVQSSCLALMAREDEVTPMPDCAIWADTGSEARWTYSWLDVLIPMLPFPVYRVCQGEGLLPNVKLPLRQDYKVTLPAFTESQTERGQLRRQCTSDFKVKPINRKLRQLAGIAHKRTPTEPIVTMWLGISLDEVGRMKSNREPWIENRWPLIEKRMTRSDCLLWMERHGYPRPGKSSCVFCPFHSDGEWADVRQNDPDGWQTALQVDELIRDGVRGRPERLYLHGSLKPLAEVDLRTDAERGQLDLWGNECSGYCHT